MENNYSVGEADEIYYENMTFPFFYDCGYSVILRNNHNYNLMRATKIIHQGESRIKVDFPYNQEITALIKHIEDAKWSKTFAA